MSAFSLGLRPLAPVHGQKRFQAGAKRLIITDPSTPKKNIRSSEVIDVTFLKYLPGEMARMPI
jgi:hypothetical protein